jgi:hypothetical protein
MPSCPFTEFIEFAASRMFIVFCHVSAVNQVYYCEGHAERQKLGGAAMIPMMTYVKYPVRAVA